MAKTLVVNESEDTCVPFLRGILARSLQNAGLGFNEAYSLATRLRAELSSLDQITTGGLRERILQLLRSQFDEQAAQAYLQAGRSTENIMVRDKEGKLTPFLEYQHRLCLETSGLCSEDAKLASKQIHRLLLSREDKEINAQELVQLTRDLLATRFSEDAARRYLVWTRHSRSGLPLIILIGGATGCGKSTVATEVAHRLGVVRTQSTDLLREVMRMMIPERLMPVLHHSSFNAWQSVKNLGNENLDEEELIAAGYLSQMELLSLPCEAVITRAIRERVSLILEGIHVHPSLMRRFAKEQEALIIPITIAVLKKNTLINRLQGREHNAPQRIAEHYLSNFDQIWALQSFLLSEADRHAVPIISNHDKSKATGEVLRTIIDAMSKHKSFAQPEDSEQ